jgi:putative flippase GtrA
VESRSTTADLRQRFKALARGFDGAERNRLIRFAIVGGSNTAVALVLYTVAVGLGVWYPVAALLGYAAGMANGYTWNRLWTFQAGSFHLPEFSRYVLVQGCGMVANVVALAVAVEALAIGEIIAEIVTLPPIVLVTYLANRHWTFRERAATQPSAAGSMD